MGKESDLKEDIELSLSAVQRLRERREALLDEIKRIDESLEDLQRQIGDILSQVPLVPPPPAEVVQSRLAARKQPRKESELTVSGAVLQVIQEARREINKSEIRIRAMRLAGPFSESALNSALSHWVDEKEITNTARGCYMAA